MRHLTKDKGDRGTIEVLVDLARCGISACLPISEHLPFDLIAVSEEMLLRRVQAKFRKSRNGVVLLTMRSSYTDRHGTRMKPINLDEIDVLAIYCPERTNVHYIKVDEIKNLKAVTIRLTPPKNNQKKGVRMWDDSINPHVIFE